MIMNGGGNVEPTGYCTYRAPCEPYRPDSTETRQTNSSHHTAYHPGMINLKNTSDLVSSSGDPRDHGASAYPTGWKCATCATADTRLRLRAPGQFLGRQVEHERHLHHRDVGARLQDRAEGVHGDQQRFLVPQPAQVLAMRRNGTKPSDCGSVTHPVNVERVVRAR